MCFEIYIVPYWGQGHIFPCIELCHQLASRNMNITLIVPSTVVTSLPSSLHQHPLLRIAQFTSPPTLFPHHELAPEFEHILSNNPTRPACIIVDVVLSWSVSTFAKFCIPTVAFFTSSACSAAMELATWKAHSFTLNPGETRSLPGLPESMAITHYDLKQLPHHPPLVADARPFSGRAPPKEGDPPPWVEHVRETIALMINTCDDLERPFINYAENHFKKPVWGVGPLLPEQFWNSTGSSLHDRDIRSSNRRSSMSEEEVKQWLDSKPHGSVLYVSFGTEVGPTSEEHEELARALELCEHPFIWVIQPGSGGAGNEEGHFGKRGLIIRGWAPQLLILRHPSTGGFFTHCGWNSTVEGVGGGVPLLAWPLRGDQHRNAKLVVSHLKVGYMVSEDLSVKVARDDIVKGINKLMMGDRQMNDTTRILSAKFHHGFPTTSLRSLDHFKDCIL